MSRRIRRQLLRALPPPLINNFVPPQAMASPSADERHMHRDPICYCRMPTVLMITLLLITPLFMLTNLTSMLGLQMLVSKIVMIYVLVLISKLPTFSTIQKHYCRPFPKLTMSSFADVLRLQKNSVCNLRGGNQGHALDIGMKVFWVSAGIPEVTSVKDQRRF